MGEYWKPVYNLLEDQFTLFVVNAHNVKHVPGLKTDMKDAEWLCKLMTHGLLSASFIPPQGQRELRELTRARSAMVRERTNLVNRLHKTLEAANIKLTSVVTDVQGVSARLMLAALLEVQTERFRLQRGVPDKFQVYPTHLFGLKLIASSSQRAYLPRCSAPHQPAHVLCE